MTISQENTSQAANAANIISEFVADEQVRTLSDLRRALFESSTTGRRQIPQTSPASAAVVALCGSAILSILETVVSMVVELVEATDCEPVVLVICGGIGHSTQLLYDAVARHPEYSRIMNQVRGQPEVRVFETIAEHFFHLRVGGDNKAVESGPARRLRILIEDASTNCELNAVYTRKILDEYGYISPRSIVVAQDPTMCRCTVAAFEQVYSDKMDEAPTLISWPTFVPRVAPQDLTSFTQSDNFTSCLRYDIPEWNDSLRGGIWSMDRLMSLLMGEIPRMRDDENGYGPRGKGFIAHVDIPKSVLDAWEILCDLLGQRGR
ncbi:hypothetical protein F53441_13900 [Fusarium austroafricanum]|uniref:DUF218 domain-containing protein n=1 Tax=Fusarium austroafricanum TaxID=2364996 RepID=A0A8H4JJZ0_9HYPO|nr:hypothetical protein F53441_13900 [Fusarium austroafricanum]